METCNHSARPNEGSSSFRRPLSFLIGGEPLHGSSPVADTGRALEAEGHKVTRVANIDATPPEEWRRLCHGHDVLIFIRYHGGGLQIRRQLYIARDEGSLVVRLWAGSDAWFAANRAIDRKNARRLAKAVDLNIAASRCVRERLSSVDIESSIVPPRADVSTDSEVRTKPLPPAILAYLLNGRQEFYGLSYVRAAALAFPEVPFIVVGDDTHLLGDLPNVESLGFVKDLSPVWARTGCLMRLTEHDSAPRMIETALSLGCYVIFNKPKEGCWLARTQTEVRQAVERFSAATTRNMDAPVFSAADQRRHAELILQEVTDALKEIPPAADQKLRISLLSAARQVYAPIRYVGWRFGNVKDQLSNRSFKLKNSRQTR